MVEITFHLLVLVLWRCTTIATATLLRSLYFTTLPRASITPTSRTERARLLVELLWASPREFTRSRRYPKYRNNPPFRFNLLHFARIHVEPL